MKDQSLANVQLPDCNLSGLREIINSGFCSSEVTLGEEAQTCKAYLETVRLGMVDVLAYRGAGVQNAHRRMTHIRQDCDDHYMLYLPLSAHVDMQQNGQQTHMRPGTFSFVAMARPFVGTVYAPDRKSFFASAHVRIPAALIRERFPRIDDFCSQTFAIKPGASRIMTAVIDSALLDGPTLTEEQGRIFGRTLVDLIANAALENTSGIDFGDQISNNARTQTLEKVKAFIEANLSNPRLNTTYIAERCNISVRYLHTVFESSGSTVASFTRELRLQKCRAALRDASLQDRSIIEIAFSWGFNDASHFSRAYKARFGIAPSEERRLN